MKYLELPFGRRKIFVRVVTFFSALAVACFIIAGSVFASLSDDFRTWKDAKGKFEIKAKLLNVKGDTVVLEKQDGAIIEVPMEKLSALDQGFVEGRMSDMKGDGDENPFKEIKPGGSGSSSMKGSSTPIEPGVVRNIKVDFQACPEISIEKGKWQPSIPDQSDLSFGLKAVTLPGKKEFFEKLTHAATNTVAKRSVLTHHFGRHGKPSYSRMELIDLESRKVLSNAKGEGSWKALAINDTGEFVVVQNVSDSEEAKGQLGTVRLQGKKIVPIDLWRPYETLDEPVKEQMVTYAKFINNNRLLTVSQGGKVVIWDFATKKPIRRLSYHGACQPSLTNDRKFLAICGGDIVGFVNLEDEDDEPSVKDAPGMNYWLSSAFSPSCKRFAAATMQKLMVWDVASGDVLFEGGIPGISTSGKLFFPDEEFVIVNNDKLVEFATGIKLWKYNGGFPVPFGGKSMFAHVESKGGKLMPFEIPHPEALALLKEAKAQSDLFVLKKGVDVSLDLNGVPGKYRSEVEKSLKDQIGKMGFNYSSSAKVSFKASISGPKTEAISYHFAGSFVVQQYDSKLEIMYAGKAIWTSKRNNIPGMVSGRGKDEVKKQLAKAGQKPNLGFFGSVNLPDFLQKPTGDGKQGNQQMLGSSRVTLNGLE